MASMGPVDYVVVALVLLVSLGIGVLFAVKDFRNVNREEYLLGGRRMFMLPVALSLFATFASGVSFVGAVTDIYMYGGMSSLRFLGSGAGYLLGMLTIVPLMYPLQLTSIYEYLELRFHSRLVRNIAVLIGMLQTLSYVSTALLSPALALKTGADLPLWLSVGVVGFVGTVYTAIGGMKSVIWTDAFQCFVMLAGLLTIIIKGVAIVGGGEELWKIVKAGGRTNFNDFSFDPRQRDTWWGVTIGQSIMWLPVICSQSSHQRIAASRSLSNAKKMFLINGSLECTMGLLLTGMAWVAYAYFVHIQCDPYQAGFIQNANQIPPYFVMHAMTDLPGIGGLYMAMIFSASLSTVSSGMSALAANTVEDFLKKPLKNVQERTATSITKLFVFLYGILIIGLAFGANSIPGSIAQMFGVSVGGFGGPVVGVFLLGALTPLANKYGALFGGAISVAFNVWIVLGSQINQQFEKPLPYPPTDKCFPNNSGPTFTKYSSSHQPYFVNETLHFSRLNISGIQNLDVQGSQQTFGFFLYDITYEWYGLIGVLNSLLFGTIISCCTRKYCEPVTEERLLFPFVRRFWSSMTSRVKHQNNDGDANGAPMLVDWSLVNVKADDQLMKRRTVGT